MANEDRHRGGQHRGHQAHHGRRDDRPRLDTSAIRLKRVVDQPIDPELFNAIAHQVAKIIGGNERGNKPSQIRQFYDELVMWEEKALQTPEKFQEYLPFIRMLNAKAAYAQGRKNVDENFTSLISHCLGQVDNLEALHNFKLFFEAFLGFYKPEGPRG